MSNGFAKTHEAHLTFFEKLNTELKHVNITPYMMKPWINILEISKIEDLTARQVRLRIEKGKLPQVNKEGRCVVMSTEAYFRSLDSRLAALAHREARIEAEEDCTTTISKKAVPSSDQEECNDGGID